MIPWRALGAVEIRVGVDETFPQNDSLLADLGTVPAWRMQVPADAIARVGSNDDWVPFRVVDAAIGRRRAPQLTGPAGESSSGSEKHVNYELTFPTDPQLDALYSPSATIHLPEFALAAPTITALGGGSGGWEVILPGAVEVRGAGSGSQTNVVQVLDDDGLDELNGPDLLVSAPVVVTHPEGAWDGVLIGVETSTGLFLNAEGVVAGSAGDGGETNPEIYFQIIEPLLPQPHPQSPRRQLP